MDQFAANKWLPKIEQDIRPESELPFNPFPAEHLPVFPSASIENQTQNPKTMHNVSNSNPWIENQTQNSKTIRDVLNSNPSSSSSQRTSDHRKVVVDTTTSFPSFNTISFGGGGGNNSKSTAAAKNTAYDQVCTESNGGHVYKSKSAADIASPAVGLINFSSSSPVITAPTTFEEFYGAVEYDELVPPMKSGGGGGRTSLQCQEHILAERKRREKLSKSFIALSAIVPGLKKLDKASVLDGAIKYVKQLEERLKNVDENSTNNITVSKRTRQSFSGDTLSSDENHMMCSVQDLNQSSTSSFPEIDVKISGENVLLRIFCHKIDGIFKEIIYHVENLNLSIINTSSSPFGKFNLYIAIVAQTDGDFSMSCQGLAKYIREVVQDFV